MIELCKDIFVSLNQKKGNASSFIQLMKVPTQGRTKLYRQNRQLPMARKTAEKIIQKNLLKKLFY